MKDEQMETTLILAFLIGLIAGVILLWLFLRGKLKQSTNTVIEHQSTLTLLTTEKTTNAALQTTVQTQTTQLLEYKQSLDQAQNQVADLNIRCAVAENQIAEERKAAAEKLAILNDAQLKLSDAFKALSAEALKNNNDSFISLAKTQFQTFQQGAEHDLEKRQKSIDELVKPLKEGLENVDKKVQQLDQARIETYTALNEQVKNLVSIQTALQGETQNLVQALRKPTVRGRWGEIQLKNVVEMAGMVEYCDFDQQESVAAENGRLRPDMKVRLPAQKIVVVDSKTPLEAYLNSIEATDETVRLTYLKDHARQVRSHLQKLSEKAYWDQFDQSPEFVVLFLPGEMFFSAALEQDPGLIEAGVRQKIIIATPTTLIALLRAVSYGWTQERLSRNAEEISNLGKKLYARIRTFASHMGSMRNSLQKAIDSHNKAIGSLEASVLPPARSLKNLSGSSDDDIETIEPIETMPRAIQSNELLLPGISVDEDMT